MRSEYNKYPEENRLIKELLANASEARRFYLKFDIIDKIISLFTSDKEQSDDSKWDNLMSLQKRINTVKYELGEADSIVLMREVVEGISEYLGVNKTFQKEAMESVKLLKNIQNKKVKTLEQVFRMESDQ